HAARGGRRKPLVGFLLGTAILGALFLSLKGVEYFEDDVHRLVPGASFRGSAVEELFFSFYFVMTGIHALHLIIGIAILCALTAIAWRAKRPPADLHSFEVSGLYWHFVDIVWIFVIPLLYLPGRH